MPAIRRSRRWAPCLWRLENRIEPASLNALVSRADPTMFSATAGGTQVSADPNTMSADGRYVGFTSSATNVIAGQVDNNAGSSGGNDVFLYDRVTNSTELISHASGLPTTTGDGASFLQMISADGRFVAFTSGAHDLVAGMTGPSQVANVFLYDRMTDQCTLISHQFTSPLLGDTSGGEQVVISGNGQVVVFSSRSSSLVPNIPSNNSFFHAYAYSWNTGQLKLIDHSFSNPALPGNKSARAYDTSFDGQYVAISSTSTNLTSVTVKSGQVFRYDTSTGSNLVVSQSVVSGPMGATLGGGNPSISNDGTVIAFSSDANNLVAGYSGSGSQIYRWEESTGAMTLVTHTPTGGNFGANGITGFPQISRNGKIVVYHSPATDLISGFVDGNGANNKEDLFLYDSDLDQTILLSRQYGSTTTSANNGFIGTIDLSDDGGLVVFGDRGTDLVSGFVGNGNFEPANTYVYRRATDTISLLSGKYGSPNVAANLPSAFAGITPDGVSIVFTTAASDVIPGLQDANNADDVFIQDVATGDRTLATRRFGMPSLSASGDSQWTQTSADGRFVIYTSMATNLVASQIDQANSQDVFLYDRQLNTTTLVSHAYDSPTRAASGDPNGYNSAIPVVSADGRFVAYASNAQNLIANFVDLNGSSTSLQNLYGGTDIYLYDRVTGQNQLVSHQVGTTNVGGNGTSGTFNPFPDYLITISADGRYIAYFSLATNLVSGFVDHNGTTPENNSGSDVYVFDRTTGDNTLVSHTPSSLLDGGNGSSYAPSLSADGRYLAFWSYSSSLVSGLGGSFRNVFLYDQQSGLINLVSHTPASLTTGGNNWSTNPVNSGDGNYIAYESKATNLVGGTDTNNQYDVFVYDRLAQTNTLVSHTSSSLTAACNTTALIDSTAYSTNAQSISYDGKFITFASSATNLVAGFVEGYPTDPSDAYLFDRVTGINTLVSHKAGSPTAGANGQTSYGQAISGDGRFVAFISDASNVIAGYSSSSGGKSGGDLYLYDRLTGNTRLASFKIGAELVGGDGSTYAPALSYDGSVISVLTTATNLVPGDSNSKQDIVAYITPPPQVASIQINDGSVQRSIIRSITVNFDEPVFFNGDLASAFTLTRNGSAGNVQLAVSSFGNNPNGSITLTFSGSLTQFGSLMDGKYTLTIDASKVSNISALDGNGDGVAGDNWVSADYQIYRLFGDANGDRRVDGLDYSVFRMTYNTNNDILSFDGTGPVDGFDFGQFRQRFGVMI